MASTNVAVSPSSRNPHPEELAARLAVARIEMGLAAHLLAVALLEQAGARAADAREGKRHG